MRSLDLTKSNVNLISFVILGCALIFADLWLIWLLVTVRNAFVVKFASVFRD